MIVRDVVKKLKENLVNENEVWTFDEYYLYNRKRGIKIWYASGLFFLSPNDLELNIIEKVYLYTNVVKALKILKSLIPTKEDLLNKRLK